MILAQFCIADTTATLYEVRSLDPNERDKRWYELHMLDLPTGEREVVVIEGENNALLTFAALIASDVEHIGGLDPLLVDLRSKVKSKKFIP